VPCVKVDFLVFLPFEPNATVLILYVKVYSKYSYCTALVMCFKFQQYNDLSSRLCKIARMTVLIDSDFVPVTQKENYLVTYRPNKRRAYVVIKETATSDDVVRATFQVIYMLLDMHIVLIVFLYSAL